MTRLNSLPTNLKKRLEQKALLKIISGLSNFEKRSVEMVARAAGKGGADLIDVACDPSLVELAIKASGLPICVSAVDPKLFPPAIEAGASIMEIGNFDSFYPKGRFFDAKEVFDLALQTKKLMKNVFLSVTIPHILSLDLQAQLALELADIGVDLIQTEGGTSAKPLSAGSLGLIEKASPTLAAVHTISQAFKQNECMVPVLCASGMSSVTLPMAIASGASGVGVGSVVNKLTDDISMLAVVRTLRESFLPIDNFTKAQNFYS